jgi:hypothetical protein
MDALRRTLYLQAAVWVLAGAALVVAPGFVLVNVFGQPQIGETSWLRLLGVHSVTVAMFMVLVAHRIEDLWWWSWAFALMTTAVVVVVLLNAAFGLEAGQSSVLWWAFATLAVAFDLGLLYGLFVSSRQNPM